MLEFVLPPGYTARPPAMGDLVATLAMLNDCDRPHAGCNWHSAVVLEGFWTHPDIVLARDVRIVLDAEDAIRGYVQVWNAPPHVQARVFGRVHPGHRGRGIGTRLCAWGEQLAASRMDQAPPGTRLTVLSWTLAGNEAAARLLAGRGLACTRHSFNMKVELDTPLPAPAWPDGIELRTFDRAQMREMFLAQREAFRDHFGFVERDEASDWARHMHWVSTDPRWDPNLIYVARAGSEIAGVCECWRESDEDPDMGWIAQLGVRRPWRRRGVARALLLHSFAQLGGMGCRRVGLGVDADSLTGATGLYESVGMSTYRVMDDYEKVIRPGREISRT